MCLIMSACNRNKTIPLVEGYALASYESVPDDMFLIVDGSGKVVIPPHVKIIKTQARLIIGRLQAINNPSFPDSTAGYFVLDVASGEVVMGLTPEQLQNRWPQLSISGMRQPPYVGRE